MEDIAEDIREGRSTSSYPSIISNDSDAKSFYGVILKVLKNDSDIDMNLEFEEKLAYLSINVKETIKQNAKRDWRNSKIVIDKIEGKLDDGLFDFMDENSLDLSDEILDFMLEKLMIVAQKRF